MGKAFPQMIKNNDDDDKNVCDHKKRFAHSMGIYNKAQQTNDGSLGILSTISKFNALGTFNALSTFSTLSKFSTLSTFSDVKVGMPQ